MNISIDFSSLHNMQGNMEKRAKNIKHAIGIILQKSLFVLEGKEKFYSPVDTGRMRASISEGRIFGDNFASIGPTVEYAKYVNRRIPFMSAAAQDSLAEIQQIAQKEITKALE